jgi:hypothetical protein
MDIYNEHKIEIREIHELPVAKARIPSEIAMHLLTPVMINVHRYSVEVAL